MISGRMADAGEDHMIHSDLVEAPWLIAQEYGPDDPDATITLSEFRALAWVAANDKARELGWLV